MALEICVNLDHRGGCGCDANTGDGAGMFLQIPDKFFRKEAKKLGFTLPDKEHYGVGFVYLSPDEAECAEEIRIINEVIEETGQELLGWRDVPIDNSSLGKASAECEPAMRQVFIKRGPECHTVLDFERVLFLIRRVADHRMTYQGLKKEADYYFSSLSSSTIVYKGMLTTEQLGPYFKDFSDPDMETAMALVHSRFSTNTFPSWPRAQPFRYMCHNGEINTVRGNENWMQARQRIIHSDVFGVDVKKLLPVIREGGSDSQNFDNCLEFLTLTGRSLPHAMMMMIPEPWEKHENMSQLRRDFYEYHACLMEPWDGPASIAFSDGKVMGAVLDRNGLRPSRYYVTKDDLVIMASEVGVIPSLKSADVVKKGRLKPGHMFLVDVGEGRIIEDAELKGRIMSDAPYGEWLRNNLVCEDDLPEPEGEVPGLQQDTLLKRQQAFGYTYEDKQFIIGPSSQTGVQPIGSTLPSSCTLTISPSGS